MNLFILVGTGVLGALFVAGQNMTMRVGFLWKFLLGIGSGGLVFAVLKANGGLPADATIGGFIMLFALGGLAGGLAVLLYVTALHIFSRS